MAKEPSPITQICRSKAVADHIEEVILPKKISRETNIAIKEHNKLIESQLESTAAIAVFGTRQFYIHALWIHVPQQFRNIFLRPNSCERGESGLSADKRRLKYYTNRQIENAEILLIVRSSREDMVNDEWSTKKPLQGRIQRFADTYHFHDAFVPNYVAEHTNYLSWYACLTEQILPGCVHEKGDHFPTGDGENRQKSTMYDVQFEPSVEQLQLKDTVQCKNCLIRANKKCVNGPLCSTCCQQRKFLLPFLPKLPRNERRKEKIYHL